MAPTTTEAKNSSGRFAFTTECSTVHEYTGELFHFTSFRASYDEMGEQHPSQQGRDADKPPRYNRRADSREDARRPAPHHDDDSDVKGRHGRERISSHPPEESGWGAYDEPVAAEWRGEEAAPEAARAHHSQHDDKHSSDAGELPHDSKRDRNRKTERNSESDSKEQHAASHAHDSHSASDSHRAPKSRDDGRRRDRDERRARRNEHEDASRGASRQDSTDSENMWATSKSSKIKILLQFIYLTVQIFMVAVYFRVL